MAVIRGKGLYKAYGGNKVLENFNVELRSGSPVCVMGQSGCGKTTLTHILLGLIKPDAGSVEGVKGLRLAAVFQEDRLLEELSAVANVNLVWGRRYGLVRINAELAGLGITSSSAALPVRELSGGMKRRVAIVRALAGPSDFVVLDEPFKGLDPSNRALAVEYVRQRVRDRAALIVSHDSADANELGARVVTM